MPSRDCVFLTFVVLFLLLNVWNRLHLPSFWDETKVYFSPLFHLYDDPSYYFTGPATQRDRPIGLHLLYLPFLYVFGESLTLVRALSTIYFLAGVLLFYRVIREDGFYHASLTLALFILAPIVQVYAPQYVGDPQLFTLFALYTFLVTAENQRPWALTVVGLLAGLVREPALALVPATAVYFLHRYGKLRRRDLLPILSPILGLSVHLLRNYFHSGNFFNHVTVQDGHFDWFAGIDRWSQNSFGVLLATYRLFPLLCFSVLVLTFRSPRLQLKPLDLFSLVIVVAYVCSFSGLSVVLPRYFLPCVPFLIHLLLRCSSTVLTSKRRRILFVIFAVGVPLLIGNPNKKDSGILYHFTGHQDTLEYPRILEIHKAAMNLVKKSLPSGARVATGWPFIEMLRSSKIGYGARVPYRINDVSAGTPDAVIWTNFPEQLSWDLVQEFKTTASYSEKEYRFEDYLVRVLIRRE